MTPNATEAGAAVDTLKHGLLVQISQGKWVTTVTVNPLRLYPHHTQRAKNRVCEKCDIVFDFVDVSWRCDIVRNTDSFSADHKLDSLTGIDARVRCLFERWASTPSVIGFVRFTIC